MKRSKMITKMGLAYSKFCKKEKINVSPFNIDQINKLMDCVLQNLEDSGMKPPKHAIRFEDGNNAEEFSENWEFEG